MVSREAGDEDAALLQSPAGTFSDAALAGLPDPVTAYFRHAVAAGSPIAAAARIGMRGSIKVGRWLPFRARELLNPHRGFVWTARAAGVISGSDRLVADEGAMAWRLLGVVPVMRASGPAITRSAIGRAAGEAVWLPTTLLPRFGVEWSASGPDRLRACCQVSDQPIQLDLTVTPAGAVRSVVFERWGDPDNTGTFALHPFGGEFTAHGTFEGVKIPTEGRLGWHYGTDRWPGGEFFRFRITDMELVTDAPR